MKAPRKDPWYRVWLSRGYNFLLLLFFGVPYHDMDTGFRLIRRKALHELMPEVRHMTTFTAEFVVRAHYAGYKIVGVPVHHYERKIGATSNFFISSLVVICLRHFLSVLTNDR